MKYLTLRCNKPKLEMRLLMGAGDARITSGLGGHTTIARPRQISATYWNGQEPIAQDVPIMLDGFRDGRSVQRRFRTLQRLARSKDDDAPPPVFRLIGPVHHSNKHWVLSESGLELADGAIRNDRGVLVRQPLILHCLEYVKPDILKRRRRGRGRGGSNGVRESVGGNMLADVRESVGSGVLVDSPDTVGPAHLVVAESVGGAQEVRTGPNLAITRQGDTLIKVAVREFGDWKRWRYIGRLNDLRDPNRVLPSGTRLRL